MKSRNCNCGAKMFPHAKFCAYCGQPLATRGIREEFRPMFRQVFQQLQPSMNENPETNFTSDQTKYQPGEVCLGRCVFEPPSSLSPEQRTVLNESIDQILERVFPPFGVEQESDSYVNTRSVEYSVANMEVGLFSVSNYITMAHQSDIRVFQLAFTTHRLIINDKWSIWWSRVKRIQVEAMPSDEAVSTEVFTIIMEQILEPWNIREEVQGLYVIVLSEPVVTALLREPKNEESWVKQLAQLIRRIDRYLEPVSVKG